MRNCRPSPPFLNNNKGRKGEMIAALMTAALGEPVLDFSLLNGTYAEMAQAIGEQTELTITVGKNLAERRVILLCKDQPFEKIRSASTELLALKWSETEEGWHVERSPEHVELEAALRKKESAQTLKNLREVAAYLADPELERPAILKAGAATIAFAVALKDRGLMRALESGKPLVFSATSGDGFIPAALDSRSPRLILRYLPEAQEIWVGHWRSGDSDSFPAVVPEIIRLTPSAEETEPESGDWTAEAPEELIKLKASQPLEWPESEFEGSCFSAADSMQHLHLTTGAPVMMEGSRRTVSRYIPNTQNAYQFLNYLVRISRQDNLAEDLDGSRFYEGWVSLRFRRWWALAMKLRSRSSVRWKRSGRPAAN